MFLVAQFAWEREPSSFEHKADRAKDDEEAPIETSNPEPLNPIQSGESKPENIFETPQVESLTDLIKESENKAPNSNPEPEYPPLGKPLRLPGRIYRNGS